MSKIKLFKIIFFIIISCNISYGQYDKLQKCINEKCVKYDYSNSFSLSDSIRSFDLFDSIKNFETFLIKSKLLKDKTQKSYSKLIKKDFSFNKKKRIIEQVKFEFPFYYDFNDESYNMIMMYNGCPYEIAGASLEMSSLFYPVIKIYNKIIAEGGYPTKSILKELSCKTDYNNEISRLLLCNLIYYNWLSNYKEEMIKYR